MTTVKLKHSTAHIAVNVRRMRFTPPGLQNVQVCTVGRADSPNRVLRFTSTDPGTLADGNTAFIEVNMQAVVEYLRQTGEIE